MICGLRTPQQSAWRQPHTMGDDKYARIGIIPSAARAGGSVIEGTKMLRVMVMARRKMPKSAQNIFNNQQRLVVAMEGSEGVVRMGPPWSPHGGGGALLAASRSVLRVNSTTTMRGGE